MKKKGIETLAVMAAITAATVMLSAGAIYGMSCLAGENTVSEPSSAVEGGPVSVFDGKPLIDSRPPACMGEESQPDIQSEAEESEQSEYPGDGILIRAIDLSRIGEDGLPETLVSNFSGMSLDEDYISSVSTEKLNCDGSNEVVLYHTHAAEAYAPGETYELGHQFLSENDEQNMVAVGCVFASVLRSHGVGVIHDTYHHSSDGYGKAYSSSRRSLIEELAGCSTVKLSVDIHRDSVSSDGSERKPLTFIDGMPTAQVMLVAGSGHGAWRLNLANALAFQRELVRKYPGLARPIYLSKGEYNQSLMPGALLLEVGAAGNLQSEALAAARLAAEAFCSAFAGDGK